MFKRLSEQDYYQVLEVSYGATVPEIQAAYDRVRDIYRTDSLVAGSVLTAEERRDTLERIGSAYHTLIAEESRRLYDESLAPSCEELRAVLAAGRDRAPKEDPARFPKLFRGSRKRSRASISLGDQEEANGDFLRRAREAAGVDLRTIATETKISSTTLTYIEEERVDRLPAPVYLRSFVAQYARFLGLDEDHVAGSYMARIKRLAIASA